jgi:hypothetical protein
MYRVVALATALFATSGCMIGQSSCGHASETTYRCVPVLATTQGCMGGPRGGDAMTARVYPIGCQVDVPECSELDPGIPRTFECVIGANGEPAWYEPI